MKRYRLRFILALFVFAFFKLTNVQNQEDFFEWNIISTVSLVYMILVFLILWEVIFRYIRRQRRSNDITTNKGLYIISTKAALLVLPLVFLFAFIYDTFLINFECCPNEEIQGNFIVNSAQGFVIGLLIISYEIILIYIKNAIKEGREKEVMQKELVAAKYEGLKNQVNPHFLFNSFSVLSALVEDDSKKAIEFISKLSDMYRYILENDQKSVVSLEAELEFLDSYIFLLKMRHQAALVLKIELSLRNMHAMLPPMSIQLIVENAVKHNRFSIDEPLEIVISNEEEKSIVVSNTKRPKESLTKSTKIGLKNLSKRLQLATNKPLEITDGDDSFKVRLPLISQ
ncbi:MAG: histidine kinase [Ekhidna sp.]|nr:histidine kinase [Ekhidna sp.]